jgi:hypothetical protein
MKPMTAMTFPRRATTRSARFAGAWAVVLFLCGALDAVADNGVVSVVNVTPTTFSVVWKGPVGGIPSLRVYSDAGARTNLAGALGIEAFPHRTGSLLLDGTPETRRTVAALGAATASRGLMEVRVTHCTPSTTYYFATVAHDTNGGVSVSPGLNAVTTADENSFIPAAEQLLLTLSGSDNYGTVVALVHPNAAYPLAAVVGDGAGTNQVAFNLGDLFNAAGGGNFAPTTLQNFEVDLAESAGAQFTEFPVGYTANFGVVNTVSSGLATEIVSLIIGQTAVQAGHSGVLPITFISKAGLASAFLNVTLPAGKLTNFTLQALSPAVDPAATTITATNDTAARIQIVAKAGQSFTGSGELLGLGFTAQSNLSSSFVPATLASLGATRSDGLTAPLLDPQSGRVAVVGPTPLLEPLFLPGEVRELTLYGIPSTTYTIQASTTPTVAASWTTFAHVTLTNGLSQAVQGLNSAVPAEFFRAVGP